MLADWEMTAPILLKIVDDRILGRKW
jgi:hypothetical protein